MARGTQHRKRRPPQNARLAPAPAGPKRPKRPAYEEQLFFGRLRVHAKWLFVFLALVFSLGFIFLGIGSGSTGISQIVENFFSGTLVERHLALVAAEEDAGAPEGRRGVARLREQAPAEEPAGQRGAGAHDLHAAQAEGHRRPAAARGPLPAARLRLADAPQRLERPDDARSRRRTCSARRRAASSRRGSRLSRPRSRKR